MTVYQQDYLQKSLAVLPDQTNFSLDSWPPSRITRVIQKMLRADLAVCEDLASEIWTECFEKHLVPSRFLIRRRVIDLLRSRSRELLHNERYLHQQEYSARDPDRAKWVNELIDQTVCTSTEKQVLFLCYWQGLSNSAIGTILGVDGNNITAIKTTILNKLYATAKRRS